MKTKWGILATGGIARKMATALNSSEFAEIRAVGSRDEVKARDFAKEFEITHAYGSYEALLEDPDIDIVYIATPHPFHHPWILASLEAGKHVLCEKPLTMNAEEARECIDLAREKGLFLMEALWTRFFPLMFEVRRLLQEKVLGELNYVQADFMAYRSFAPDHRLFNPDLGGGALLDLGVYPINIACHFLGLPDKVEGQAHLLSSGVDVMNTVIMEYDDGKRAVLNSGFNASIPCECIISGEKGYLRIHHFFHQPHTFTLYLDGGEPEEFHFPYKGNGLVHQTEAVHECLQKGLTEHPLMPLDETLAVMGIMDDLKNGFRN